MAEGSGDEATGCRLSEDPLLVDPQNPPITERIEYPLLADPQSPPITEREEDPVLAHAQSTPTTEREKHWLMFWKRTRHQDAPNENRSNTDAGAGEPGQRRDYKHKVVYKYEAKLKRAKGAALVQVALHSFNWFTGVCTVTWATGIVLGGFVSNLKKFDFVSVAALLLLEAIRLALATFFGNIVTRNLVDQSTDPRKLQYDDSDRQMIFAVVRIVGPPSQLIFIVISVFLPLSRLPNVGGEYVQAAGADSFDGLSWSLRIFYALVLLSAIVSAVAVLYSVIMAPWFVKSYSLRRYYDEVVWSGICKGLLNASDFHVLTFAFKMQSEEYRRNIRAVTVRNLYEDLLEYLFWQKKGFEAVRIALDSTDSYEQEAAANIVGLWTRWDEPKRRVLGLQRRLLAKLADMVDNEETGRAATSSFQLLAKYDPEGVLEVRSESREKLSLVDILTRSIDSLVKAGKYNRTVVYVKALIPLLENETCRETLMEPQFGLTGGLTDNLTKVFSNNCLKRSKAVAGHALRQINSENPTPDDVKKFLREPVVEEGEHILEEEKNYLLNLLDLAELPNEWLQPPNKLEVRNFTQETNPYSAKYSGKMVAFIAAAVTVVGIAVAVVFFYRIVCARPCFYRPR